MNIKTFALAPVVVLFLTGCSQPSPAPAQAQVQVPQRSEVISFQFRDDGRKIALVQDPDGTLRMCELRGGDQLRWDCVVLPSP